MDATATYPSCVLKVNIGCCEACVKNIHKLLSKTLGVYAVNMDPDKGLVTVIGTASPETLIKQIAKKKRKAFVVSYEDPTKDKNKESGNTNEDEKTDHFDHNHDDHYCSGHKVEDYVPPEEDYEICRDPHCRDHHNKPCPRPDHHTPTPIIRVPPRVHPNHHSFPQKDHFPPQPPPPPHSDSHYPPPRPRSSFYSRPVLNSHFPPPLQPHLDSHYPPPPPPPRSSYNGPNSHYKQYFGEEDDRPWMNKPRYEPDYNYPRMPPRSPPYYGGYGPRPPPPSYGVPVTTYAPDRKNNITQYFSDENSSGCFIM